MMWLLEPLFTLGCSASPLDMASPSPCSPSLPTRRRRPAAWREYQIDHSEPHSCAPASSEWPKITSRAQPPANDQLPQVQPFTSLSDLAERLHVCTATLAREIERGKLAGHKVGSQWRFTEQQITDYLKLTERSFRLYGRPKNDNDPL
jgi:excisionase family DNA binding protein